MPTSSKDKAIRLAIFASGGGSNAEQIIRYFAQHASISVRLIISNKRTAKVLEHAKNHDIPSLVIRKKQLSDPTVLINSLTAAGITHIVLAGFLLLVPKALIKAFPDKILNIHPSLLPKYGGKGMYGMHVHRAVYENQESVSGMTIHLVNEEYDKGKVLFQQETTLDPSDTPERIAAKVLTLEHRHYARVIEQFILKDLNI